VWFDLKLVGGFFEKLANVFPYVHAVEMEKALFSGDFGIAATHILTIVLYSMAVTALAVFCFLRQMKKQ
jgi:ABC-2 type transport system permease protein